jgi:pyridoxamine 5'-phosphate oxidase
VYLISGMRTKYKGESETFTEEDLKGKEPFSQFREWFEEACKHPAIPEANAVCLATATR